MAETLTASPLDAVEGESLRWSDDEVLLLALLTASDLNRVDRYWRLIAPAGYAELIGAVRVPSRDQLVPRPPVWFDIDAQRYGIGSRGYVQRDAYRNAVRKAISNAEGRAVRLTRSLVGGVIPIDQWQRAMAAEIRQAAAAFAVVGAGGPAGVSERIVDDVHKRLTFQFERLETYAKQIEQREPIITEPSLERRPAAYMRHTGTTHAEAERISHDEAGFLEEQNVLAPGEHCAPQKKHPELPDCPSLSAKGWVPIGTLPQVGSRVCRHQCLCSFIFRKRPPVERSN